MKLAFGLPHYHICEALISSSPYNAGALCVHFSKPDALYFRHRLRKFSVEHLAAYRGSAATVTEKAQRAFQGSIESLRLSPMQAAAYFAKIAPRLCHWERELRDRFMNKPHLLFLWNKHRFLDRYLVELVAGTPSKVLILEEGLWRGSTLTIDPEGVGTQSRFFRCYHELPLKRVNLAAPVVNEVQNLRAYQAYKLMDRLSPGFKTFENFPFFKRTLRGLLPIKKAALPSLSQTEYKFFLPLQLESDSQVLFSPLKTMTELCRQIDEALKALEGRRFRVYYKEHPLSSHPFGYQSTAKNVVFEKLPRELSSHEVIKAVDAVWTLNSTVGFEGLCQLKPVVTSANCLYSLPGLALYHQGDVQRLEQYLLQGPGPKALEEFQEKLKAYYQLPYNPRTMESQDMRAFWKRVAELIP